jgi:hypothetical protein
MVVAIRLAICFGLIGWTAVAGAPLPVVLLFTLALVRAEVGALLHRQRQAEIVACAELMRFYAQENTAAIVRLDSKVRRTELIAVGMGSVSARTH